MVLCIVVFFFFKQKTAYEMRISDWSSDVCSSDLRLKPRKFYDLVIEVAIVRPGPIQGDMVHPYLRRREGKEKVDYPSEDLRRVLGKTLGVPLFQEQAMQIAIVAAGFAPAEADRLRRAMATFKRLGTIHTFRDKFIGGMIARGYDPDLAARCFQQIEG